MRESSAGPERRYIPALRYEALTPLYDPLAAIATRERLFKRALIRNARLEDGYRVLDVGCGTGTLALMIKKDYPGIEMTGLDGDSAILSRARKKARKMGVRVRWDQGMSYDLPYEAEQFDVVFSSLMFHHLSTLSKQNTLDEVRRVLKPGGEFHLADWGPPVGPVTRAQLFAIQLLDGFETTRDNVEDRIPILLNEAGFECQTGGNSFYTPIARISLWCGKKI